MPSTPEEKRRQHARNIAEAVRTLNAMKTAAGCVDCGYNKHPAALQFDHIDPATKQAALGWVRDRSKLTTRAKLARYIAHVTRYCQIRCANCHAERTFNERHHLGPRGSAEGMSGDAEPMFDLPAA